MSVIAVYITNMSLNIMVLNNFSLFLSQHQTTTVYDSFFEVPASEVNDLISEECMFRITATTTVDTTDQLVVASHLVNVDKPDLSVKVFFTL